MTIVTMGRRLRRCLAALMLTPVAAGVAAQDSDFQGRLVFANVVELRAGVSGRLSLAAIVPGEAVAAGQELAGISKSVYSARLDSADQRVTLTRQEYDEAHKRFERNQVLYDEGSLSQVDFDLAALALTRARTVLSQAETELRSARTRADLSRVVAPFDAVVLDIALADGSYINARIEAPLIATVAERGVLAARARVDAVVRRGLSLGDTARVSVQGAELTGTVGAIRYAGLDGSPVWLVDVLFDTAAEDMVAGLPARVEFP